MKGSDDPPNDAIDPWSIQSDSRDIAEIDACWRSHLYRTNALQDRSLQRWASAQSPANNLFRPQLGGDWITGRLGLRQNDNAKILVVLLERFIACATCLHRDEVRRSRLREECLRGGRDPSSAPPMHHSKCTLHGRWPLRSSPPHRDAVGANHLHVRVVDATDANMSVPQCATLKLTIPDRTPRLWVREDTRCPDSRAIVNFRNFRNLRLGS
jgi:hypothetical protein